MNKKQYTKPRMVKAPTTLRTTLLSGSDPKTNILEAGGRPNTGNPPVEGAENVGGGHNDLFPDFN